MKISDLHIYGYGKLSNLKISGLHELQVFYGENEAGKSTLMSFIHSILFGFPTKQQTELRYEPKEGAKYGGQLTAIFESHGKAVIERVKGKATGDVRVTLEDGTVGEEELLKDLLFHVDKSLFQSIFSFNIHGLQNFHQIKAEDIGKFLFSAGTLGTDQLMRAENTIQKELEMRFKPNGKKPSINEKLKELKHVHLDLKKAEHHNEQYWTLLKEKTALEQEIKENEKELQLAEGEKSRLEAWRQIQPIKAEEKWLKEELSKYEAIQFPTDGLIRLDRLEGMIKPLEGQMASLTKRISSVEEELENNRPNEMMLRKEPDILAAVESLALLEKLKQESEELTAKLQEISEDQAAVNEKLHLPIQEDQLLMINTSVFTKEKIIHLEEQYRRLKSKRLDLDDRFNEAKQLLEEAEDKIEKLERNLLSANERAILEEKVKVANQKEIMKHEVSKIEERLQFLKSAQKKETEKAKKKYAQERFQFLLFSFLFFILIVWGILDAVWPLMIAGALGIIFSMYLFFKKSSSSDNRFVYEEIQALEEKKKDLMPKMNAADLRQVSFIESELERDRELTNQLHQYKLLWEQRNDQYEKIVVAFESWEKEVIVLERKMLEIGGELSLPKEIALAHLMDAFQLIEQIKVLHREKKLIIERKKSVTERIKEITDTIAALSNTFMERSPANLQETAYLLRKTLKEETEKQIKDGERRSKLLELEEEFNRLRIELEHFQKEQENLLKLAKAETIEHYREIGHLAESKAKLEGQLMEVKRLINRAPFNENEMEEYMNLPNLESSIREHVDKLKNRKEMQPLLQSSLAKKKYEIQVIEEGGTYAELLHKYKQMKAELNKEAKEWAKYAIAKDLLVRTIESFKNERMPKMLNKAEEFLVFLTEGNYVRIYPQKEFNGFLIENKDHQLFEVNELSQATMEQIYVSFRLALAVTVYEKFPFPIIIDDSFVNFDHKRTEKMIALLKSFTNRQILYFTCHQHLLPHFSEEQILFVNKETSLSLPY
ncbi:AAA family ATPase [Cytobacillus sp. FJAT-53684]|uniref:AAA family ATPase n=1 Tax=Cytobacillus mangrovibacter TaxID=3299024 RepID=A0ABW6JZV6_9BACI